MGIKEQVESIKRRIAEEPPRPVRGMDIHKGQKSTYQDEIKEQREKRKESEGFWS